MLFKQAAPKTTRPSIKQNKKANNEWTDKHLEGRRLEISIASSRPTRWIPPALVYFHAMETIRDLSFFFQFRHYPLFFPSFFVIPWKRLVRFGIPSSSRGRVYDCRVPVVKSSLDPLAEKRSIAYWVTTFWIGSLAYLSFLVYISPVSVRSSFRLWLLSSICTVLLYSLPSSMACSLLAYACQLIVMLRIPAKQIVAVNTVGRLLDRADPPGTRSSESGRDLRLTWRPRPLGESTRTSSSGDRDWKAATGWTRPTIKSTKSKLFPAKKIRERPLYFPRSGKSVRSSGKAKTNHKTEEVLELEYVNLT